VTGMYRRRIVPFLVLGSLAMLADSPAPPPPKPAPAGLYVASRAEGVVSLANANLGNTCIVTERIEIRRLVVKLPRIDRRATNIPSVDGKTATPAFVVPIPQAGVDAAVSDTGSRCSPLSTVRRPLSMRYVPRGSYSTADGKVSVTFVSDPNGPPATLTLSGTFNAFSQFGTATVTRVDDTDPSITWKADIAVVFRHYRQSR
jgi:hypothetical protein